MIKRCTCKDSWAGDPYYIPPCPIHGDMYPGDFKYCPRCGAKLTERDCGGLYIFDVIECIKSREGGDNG
jgi:hypothetical protein